MPLEKSLTLRQIEVIRAVMVSGSIAGAARLLNVSQPGVSRTIKHLDSVLGIKLFMRQGGRFVPTPEALGVFTQLQEVHKKLNDLQFALTQLGRGQDVELSIGSVPSIAHVMVPRATATLKRLFPDIRLNIELLKIEEAIDFLMLDRGELVCMSYRFDHPSIDFLPLATGRLVCIAGRESALAKLDSVTPADIVQHPLIGIDPKDPYGAIMARIFDEHGLDYDIGIRARFGTTVVQLVKQNLGIAVIDSFTIADVLEQQEDGDGVSGVAVLPIRAQTDFETYVAVRKDVELSGFAERFVAFLKAEMARGGPPTAEHL
ncbi:LysR family transcriptional regulator [Pelagibius marinus]|uniref:LysR family transcriptional regulator n=1 Tax=Pelagibius marinus TaxID=2762760 RepID=UPI001872F90D|nr:LysR family transcriptional regulator [Pelagibius marinus]